MEWPGGVTNSTNRRELMEPVVEVVLLKLEELTSGGNTLGTINFLGRREWSQECSECFSCLKVIPCKCFREILMARDTCLDLGVGQILTATNASPLSLSPYS